MRSMRYRNEPTTAPQTVISARWQEAAACRGLDTEMFFPGRGESIAAAKAICNGCPVKIQCAGFAMDTRQRFGVWGGSSERERRRQRSARRTANINEGTAA